jgi:hypothetical protein
VSDLGEELRRATATDTAEIRPLPAAEVIRRGNRRRHRRAVGFSLAICAVVGATTAGLLGGGVLGGGQPSPAPPAVRPAPAEPSPHPTPRPATPTASPAPPTPSAGPSGLPTATVTPSNAQVSSPPVPSKSASRVATPPSPASPTASKSP